MRALVVVIVLLAELVFAAFTGHRRVEPAHLIPPISFVKASPRVAPFTASRSTIRLPWPAFGSFLRLPQGMTPDQPASVTPSSPAQATEQTSPSDAEQHRPSVTPPPAPSTSVGEAEQAGTVWDRLAQCESRGQWHIHTGNGYEGGLQFLNSTWLSMGGGQYAKHAYQATREQQITIAEKTLAASSWAQQWPDCSKKLGLR